MNRAIGPLDVWACVISSGRWANVLPVESLFGPCTWVVPEQQAHEYKRSGAGRVLPVGSDYNVAHARNGALDHAWHEGQGRSCLMLDDDPTGTIERVDPGYRKTKPISFPQAIEILSMHRAMHRELRLFAFTHMTNTFYVRNEFTLRTAINGGCLLIDPTSLRFDVRFRTNSDVDYGLQHVAEYGGALRLNNIFMHFGRGNKHPDSGMGKYRTDELRTEMVALLADKWPGWVKPAPDNPAHPVVRATGHRRAVLT